MTGNASDAFCVEDLTVAYRGVPAIWDVDVNIPEGVLLGVVGPNGAGKTTLLRAAIQLIPKAAGTVRFFGRPYEEALSQIAYVPQRGSVDWDFPTTVIDVVLMGLYGRLGWWRRPSDRERKSAWSALEQVGMQEYADRPINQLSGGQQQRTFLARALVQDARLYLMDEPFAAVDAVTERAIVQIMQELRAAGRTVIVVHHDLQAVRHYFDWLLLLNIEVVACGPTEAVFTEENLRKTYGSNLSTVEDSRRVERAPFP
ncbi:MAG: metal ABC transporter ATP-binding protein [Anaerolineaceae bacterium]|nr:metal ABC transporter ATP-binding protein [Anaerolineaceae bacterium]